MVSSKQTRVFNLPLSDRVHDFKAQKPNAAFVVQWFEEIENGQIIRCEDSSSGFVTLSGRWEWGWGFSSQDVSIFETHRPVYPKQINIILASRKSLSNGWQGKWEIKKQAGSAEGQLWETTLRLTAWGGSFQPTDHEMCPGSGLDEIINLKWPYLRHLTVLRSGYVYNAETKILKWRVR